MGHLPRAAETDFPAHVISKEILRHYMLLKSLWGSLRISSQTERDNWNIAFAFAKLEIVINVRMDRPYKASQENIIPNKQMPPTAMQHSTFSTIR